MEFDCCERFCFLCVCCINVQFTVEIIVVVVGGGGGECLPILAIHIFIKKLIGIDHVHFKRDWEGTHIIVIFLSVLAILIYLFKIIIDINDVHFQRDMGGGGLHQ